MAGARHERTLFPVSSMPWLDQAPTPTSTLPLAVPRWARGRQLHLGSLRRPTWPTPVWLRLYERLAVAPGLAPAGPGRRSLAMPCVLPS
jgi:hypothetical protein